MEIDIQPLTFTKPKLSLDEQLKLPFGKYFTDRMFLCDWNPKDEWHHPRIVPYAPFTLDPSCLVFHYAQEIFEGLKAYRWKDGSIALFRPEMNVQRFARSAERMCMPAVRPELFMAGLTKLLDLERDWVPSAPNTSLYIRPAMIATEPILGVRPSAQYLFFIILSPVGPYYPSGFNPVNIWVENRYVRATQGGTGEAKTGGNYASSLKAVKEAKERGFDQVLWLDGIHGRFVEEVGAMNMFFVYEDKIVTAPLEGTILHGVTRDCILELAPSLGLKTIETTICVHELLQDIRSGKVKEAFGSGTAAVVTPVASLGYLGESLQIGDGKTGPIAKLFYDSLTAIQYGAAPDLFSWVHKV